MRARPVRRFGPPLALLASLLCATSAGASHVTIRPDGSGDFPTINAAVQAMSFTHVVDTIMVEPGYYDEEVNHAYYFQWVIYGRAGPELTRVRKFVSLPEEPRFASWQGGKAVGLQIETRVAWGRNTRKLEWENCIFAGGYDGVNDMGRSAPTRRCVFRDTSSFVGFGYEMHDCTFERAPAYFENVLGYMKVVRCAFRGPGALLAHITPRDESDIIFEECSFSDAADGILITPRLYWNQYVGLTRCRIERLSGTALMYKYGDPSVPENGSLSLTLRNNLISDVGCALRFLTPVPGRLWSRDDTIRAVRGNAVEATVRRASISGMRLSDVGGTGIMLFNQNDSAERHGYPENELTIAASRILRCGGDGIEIRQLPLPEREPQEIVVRDTDVEDCAGTGIRFVGSHPVVTGCLLRDNNGDGLAAFTEEYARPCSLARNTATGNGGFGLVIRSDLPVLSLNAHHNLVSHNGRGGLAVFGPYAGIASFHDAWANGGADYTGLNPWERNLGLDPLYCALEAGDLALHAESPCGPSGPYGPIGARGVGCASPTAVPLFTDSPGLRIAPNPARGSVAFSWGAAVRADELEIFDLQGRRQWSASGSSLLSGALRWDARGLDGRRLAAGVYLVRWREQGRTHSSRLVLLGD